MQSHLIRLYFCCVSLHAITLYHHNPQTPPQFHQLRHIFPILLCCGYKMIERIDAQIDSATATKTFDVKQVSMEAIQFDL